MYIYIYIYAGGTVVGHQIRLIILLFEKYEQCFSERKQNNKGFTPAWDSPQVAKRIPKGIGT
jgi:hypothetical protein